jgi:hypothetical protein
MKRWKLECRRPNGEIVAVAVDAVDAEAAAARAAARGLQCARVLGSKELPPLPPVGLVRIGHRSERNAAQGAWMITIGVVGIAVAIAAWLLGDPQEGRWLMTAAPLLAAAGVFLLLVGAIFLAIGRHGLDLAEMHEQPARAGETEAR